MWKAKKIMMNGQIMPFEDASIHPLSLAVTYATTVFEGLRAYKTSNPNQFSLFRVKDHLKRLSVGMKVMKFDDEYQDEYLTDCLIKLVEANNPDDDVYIRLLVYIEGQGLLATKGPIGFTAAAMPREKSKFIDQGMNLGISSWRRLSDNASPPRIKATANYHNARLAVHEAKLEGYDGALMLTPDDYVSEAPIACFFMVRDGKLITPSTSSNILESITRDTIITRFREMTGDDVEQRQIDRSELYFADEAFLCGTGQEVIHVNTIDHIKLGDGKIGPITKMVKEDYFDIVTNPDAEHPEWRVLF